MATFVRINFQNDQDRKKVIDMLSDQITQFFICYENAIKPVTKKPIEPGDEKAAAMDLMRDEDGEDNIQTLKLHKSKALLLNQDRKSQFIDFSLTDKECRKLDGKKYWVEVHELGEQPVKLQNQKEIFNWNPDQSGEYFNHVTMPHGEEKEHKLSPRRDLFSGSRDVMFQRPVARTESEDTVKTDERFYVNENACKCAVS